MAATSIEVLSRAQALVREGKVNEADQMMGQHLADQAAAAAIAAGQPPPAPAPRPADAIIFDFLNAVTGLLGNHPTLKSLLSELESIGSWL